LGIESLCIVSNLAQALNSILTAEAIRTRGKNSVTVGDGVEDLADEVDDGIGASTEFAYYLEIHGRRLTVARRDTGDVDKLDGFALEEETRADYVALTEGIVDEGGIARTAIDRRFGDGSSLVVARFEGRFGRNAAKRGGISDKWHRGGKVVVGSSEECGRGI